MLPNWLYGKSKSKLASILGGGGTPEDYNQVKAQVNQNTQDTTALLDNTEVNGAVNMIYPNGASKVESGITYQLNDDGTVVANGTPTGNSGFGWVTFNGENLVGKTLEFSCETTNVYPRAYFTIICRETVSGPNLLREDAFLEDKKVKVAFTVPSNTKIIIVNFNTNTDTTDNISTTLKPMLTVASYNGDYVPYAKTNKELTDDVAIKSSEITVNTTNVNSENVSRNYVNKSAGVKILVLQAKPKTDLVAGTTYELGTVPSGYLPSLSTGFIKEDVVNSTGSTALIEISSGKLKLTPRVNNLSTAYTFTISVVYV